MSIEDDVKTLTESVTALTSALVTISKRFTQNEKEIRRNRIMNRIVIGSICLDIILTTALYFNYQAINNTTREISNANARISQIQTRTSAQVLCPLYALLVGSIAHPDPASVNTPAKRAQFHQTAQVVLAGYAALHCTANVG